MKPLILSTVAFLLSLSATADNVVVVHDGGTSDGFSIKGVEKISFLDDAIRVVKNGENHDFNYETFEFMYFSSTTSGIELPDVSAGELTLSNGILTGKGEIRTYSIDGRKVLSGKTKLSTKNLPEGIYVAVNGKNRLKFKK